MLAARETRDAAKEAKVLRQMFRVHLDRGDLQACLGGDLGVVGVLVTGGRLEEKTKMKILLSGHQL